MPSCEVCKRPERTDVIYLETLIGYKWACGSCGYDLVAGGYVVGEEDEEVWDG